MKLAGRQVRALNPLGQAAALLAAIALPEWLIKGFRNADIRRAPLGPDPEDKAERRRRAHRISRLLGILRAHGLVKKIPQTQRYLPTALAAACLPALQSAREKSLAQLTAA